MSLIRLRNILCLLIIPIASLAVSAADMLRPRCPHCQTPSEYGYEDVVEHQCRLVEEKKPIKKTIYECKEVPYCQHLPQPLFSGGCCVECQACPRYKKVLLKKEITVGEKCVTKCVVEEVIRKVPRCKNCQAQILEPQPASPGSDVVRTSATR